MVSKAADNGCPLRAAVETEYVFDVDVVLRGHHSETPTTFPAVFPGAFSSPMQRQFSYPVPHGRGNVEVLLPSRKPQHLDLAHLFLEQLRTKHLR